jgi:predicted enzyme related to lactoylglutathione lyase
VASLTRARAVGVNHVAIEVEDVEAALEFYGRIFEVKLRGRAGRRAFIDMGDQFVAIGEGRTQEPDRHRHFGLVVDDQQAALAGAREAGAQVSGNSFLDPWGNHVQVVQYDEVQFTKAEPVLRGMGLDDLGKTEQALSELRAKNLIPE